MKILNFLIEKLLILQNFLYERMMYMGKVETENGAKIDVSNIAIVYTNAIMLEFKTFAKSPKALKSDIALVLYISGCEDLITDEVYLEEAKERITEAEANM